MDNDIHMTKKLMTKKLCNHVYLKTMGKFLQTSPMENDETVCYTVTLIKLFSFVPISFGYVIYKHHTVGIVLKVNPQSHCCYQKQSIKHTLRKISQYQRYFYLFRKKEMRMHLLLKSENMLRHLLQKMAALPKVLSHSVITMMTFATTS